MGLGTLPPAASAGTVTLCEYESAGSAAETMTSNATACWVGGEILPAVGTTMGQGALTHQPHGDAIQRC